MESKSALTSRTIWLAILTAVLAGFQIVANPENPLSLEPQTFAIVVSIGSVIAATLRTRTCKPISSVLPKGSQL